MNKIAKPRFATLPDWLHWQEQLHPNPIDMGLERVRRVLDAMQLTRPPFRVLTVGGTNGKGSCVTLLEAMLRAQGYRVGAYTSPHLLRYNERVRINGLEADDREFCDAFARIDAARADTSLTYFEFGTLAALDIFCHHGIQVAVLEVGMGGRLDAVNVMEPDGALIVSVGLDHQEWLGEDRDSIGFEKAGIYRAACPAVCGDRDPPARLIEVARTLGADLRVLGQDFDWQESGNGWHWQMGIHELDKLPLPALAGRIQRDNAASVIALLRLVPELGVSEEAIRSGLRNAQLMARFQRLPGTVETVFDVAHNPDAARVLAGNLAATPVTGRNFAVFGMFRDKDAEAVVLELAPQVHTWFAGGLEGPRGQTAAALACRIRDAVSGANVSEYAGVIEAYAAASVRARAGDRIVVFGSFQTVAAVLRQLAAKPANISG